LFTRLKLDSQCAMKHQAMYVGFLLEMRATTLFGFDSNGVLNIVPAPEKQRFMPYTNNVIELNLCAKKSALVNRKYCIE